MKINEQLSNLYDSHWEQLNSELSLVDRHLYTNPFLIKVNEQQFSDAKFKVMIFGQETYGWFDHEVGILSSISKLMDGYESFYLEKKYITGCPRSSFFKGFKFFQNYISKHLKLEEPEINFIYNNISKIGQGDFVDFKTGKGKQQTGVSDIIRKIEQNFFPVVSQEIDIIKPDLICSSSDLI